jgi:2'-5' RNA ligase
MMRLFLATFLNPANQAFYQRLDRELVKRHGNVLRAIPADSAHVTYAFISDLCEKLVGQLFTAISETTRAWQAFDVELRPPHVVRSAGKPRLVCADLVRGATEVARLTEDLCTIARSISPDLRPSRAPHVTLARFRREATRHDGDHVAQTLARVEGRADRVSLIQIVESVLTQRGPVYSVKSGLPLRGHR